MRKTSYLILPARHLPGGPVRGGRAKPAPSPRRHRGQEQAQGYRRRGGVSNEVRDLDLVPKSKTKDTGPDTEAVESSWVWTIILHYRGMLGS